MSRPRISIAMFMLIVLVVAVDAGIVRAVISSRHGENYYLAVVSIPPISLLVLAAILTARDLWRSGEARPFLAGYLALGTPAALVFALIWGQDWERADRYLDNVLGPDLADWLLSLPGPVMDPLETGLVTAAFAFPQIALAMLGGLLAAWGGFTVVVVGRRSRGGGTLPETAANVVG